MKSLIKFFPVALGVLALASCNNDDFFGIGNNEDGKLELIATVVAPSGSDDGITRSATVPAEAVANYSTIWQAGDKFRVYDAALQKYDAFSCKLVGDAKKVTLDTESPKVTEYAKAIFPGDAVSYAGWSASHDAVTATMYIDPAITYGGTEKSGDVTGYVSNIPCWGDATVDGDNLKVPLTPLVSYTDITVYQKAAKYIRVISAATGKSNVDFQAASGSAPSATPADFSATYPLTGYFDALLVDGGKLVADLTAPLADKYGYYIEVDLSSNAAEEAHIMIPVVAQKYDVLIIQYSADGTVNSWKELKTYTAFKDAAMPNNNVIRSGLTIGNAPITAHVESLKDLNRKLAIIASTDEYAGKTVNIYVDGVIKTGEDQGDTGAGADAKSDGKTLIIPDMSTNDKDLTVNIVAGTNDGKVNNTYTNNSLKIVDATSISNATKHANHTATINFVGGLIGTESVEINTTATLKLGGVITSSNNADGYAHKTIDVKAAKGLVLGLGVDGDFNTDMNIKVADDIPVTVDANEGTVAAIDATAAANDGTITVKSGTVTAIGATTPAATPVTVDGGKVGTLKTNGGNVAVNGGVVTTLNAAGAATVDVAADATATTITAATGTVTIAADAIVSDITTGNGKAVIGAPITSLTSAATGTTNTITATANIGTLQLSGAAPEVTLTGTTAADDDAVVIGTLQTTVANTQQTVTLTSTDRAAVGTVTFARTTSGSADAIKATSSITTTNAADVKTTVINSNGDIYTAAQLAGVTTGKAYNLRTNVTATGKWTPLNINANFTTYNNSISALDAPLFNKISGSATVGGASAANKLTIASVTYTGEDGEDNLGAIAKEVDGTVTLRNITVTTATLTGASDSKNVGGAIGKANGTVTLNNVVSNATLSGHANVGGFIGNVAGGSVSITTTTASTVTLNTPLGTYDATDDDLAGTFGNIIGSVTGTASIIIGATGNTIASFVTAGVLVGTDYNSKFKYNANVNAEGKKFSGMKGDSHYTSQPMTYEIGYTPGTATVTMYGVTKDALGNPVAIKTDDINQFND